MSECLFANKKIYNWVTEIKISKKVANRASSNIKNIHGLVSTDKVDLVKNNNNNNNNNNDNNNNKNHFCCWQDNTIHACKACIYIVVAQQR